MIDMETNGLISDHIFLSFEKDFDWNAPLKEYAGYEDGHKTNIKVLLYWMEHPPKDDRSRPSLDPFSRPYHEARDGDAPPDGSAQVDRELDRKRFLHVGKEQEAVAAAWVEKLKLREMQMEDSYASPFFTILEEGMTSDRARRVINLEVAPQ